MLFTTENILTKSFSISLFFTPRLMKIQKKVVRINLYIWYYIKTEYIFLNGCNHMGKLQLILDVFYWNLISQCQKNHLVLEKQYTLKHPSIWPKFMKQWFIPWF